jgi:nucleoid-associated protein YgaU
MALSPYSRYGSSALVGTNQSSRRHIVIGGDTLPSIAAAEMKTGYDSELWRQVAEYNGIDDLDAVAIGTALAIPPPQALTT